MDGDFCCCQPMPRSQPPRRKASLSCRSPKWCWTCPAGCCQSVVTSAVVCAQFSSHVRLVRGDDLLLSMDDDRDTDHATGPLCWRCAGMARRGDRVAMAASSLAGGEPRPRADHPAQLLPDARNRRVAGCMVVRFDQHASQHPRHTLAQHRRGARRRDRRGGDLEVAPQYPAIDRRSIRAPDLRRHRDRSFRLPVRGPARLHLRHADILAVGGRSG